MLWEKTVRDSITTFAKAAVIPFYRRKLQRFETMLSRAKAVQHESLFSKIRRCAETRFGRDHGFASIRTVADFREQVPVAGYHYAAPYINDVAKGDLQALFPPGEELIAFACTTGTTGEPKLNPVTRSWLNEYRRSCEVWGVKCLVEHAHMIGTRMMNLTGPSNLGRTPSGLNIGMISALALQQQNRVLKTFYATPMEVCDFAHSAAKYYTLLRLSMVSDVGFLLGITPSNLIRLAEAGDEFREPLIRDIFDGTLRRDLDIPEDFRRQYAQRIGTKRPDVARRLEAIVERTGTLYPKDYWPLGLISCWLGGTIGYQTGKLPEYYGSCPMRDLGLLSTEGRHTIPLHDGVPEGVLAVDGNYYEFLPVEDRGEGHPHVLEGHELQEGEEYYLVMTTSSGLYRYDIGDIVRCNGFVGEAPVLEFLRKEDQCSDMEGEKISGHQIAGAVERAFRTLELRADVVTAVPVRNGEEVPYYALLVEQHAIEDVSAARRFLELVDQDLIRQNCMYAGKRNDLYVGPPQLVRLAPGAWSVLVAAQGSRTGTGESQYKHPALVKDSGLMDQLPLCDRITVDEAQPVVEALA